MPGAAGQRVHADSSASQTDFPTMGLPATFVPARKSVDALPPIALCRP